MFNITLVQGLNRQIRRMCEHFGYEVVKLERTRIMNVSLKGTARRRLARPDTNRAVCSAKGCRENLLRKTIIRARNLAMRHEKNLVLMLRQSQNHLPNQRVLQRDVINTPRMMLKNQRVLKVKTEVLLVMAKSLEAMVNLRQMASVLQKVEALHGNKFLKCDCFIYF